MANNHRSARTLFSLRVHIVAIVAAALLPALAVGGMAVWTAAESYRTDFEDRLHDTARALALAVDAELGAFKSVVATLAGSSTLDGTPNLGTFEREARRAGEALGTNLLLIDPVTLRQVINTALPEGIKPNVPAVAEAYRQVVETQNPVITNLLMGSVTRSHVIGVAVPVERQGQVVFVLAARLDPNRLANLLAAHGGRGASFAALIDGDNVVVARSRDHARFIGQRLLDWFVRDSAGRELGLLIGPNRLGVETISAFQRLSAAPGWFVVYGDLTSVYQESLWQPLAALVLGGLATIILALFVAYWIGWRILRPVADLTRKAEEVAASDGKAEVVEDAPAGVAEFERLRQAAILADRTLRQRVTAVATGEARLRAVVDTAVDAIVVTDESGLVQSFNRAAEVIFGYRADEMIGRNVSILLVAKPLAITGPAGRPADLSDDYAAAYARLGARKMAGSGREVEGRRKDGRTMPLDLAIAEWRDPGGGGGGGRCFTGIMRDISARKADEARRQLLTREVDHRAKNALAVVQAVLRLTPRDEPAVFAAAVEGRVAALARVHSLLAEEGWSGADLRTLAERELGPYTLPGQRAVSLEGPPVALAAAALQPLAMVLHELATNAFKHGALSAVGGEIDLRWRACRRDGTDGVLHLSWAEHAGPSVPGAPERRGFGTRIIETTVRGQLGGSVEWCWERTGLICKVTIPLGRVAAKATSDAKPSDRLSDQSAAHYPAPPGTPAAPADETGHGRIPCCQAPDTARFPAFEGEASGYAVGHRLNIGVR